MWASSLRVPQLSTPLKIISLWNIQTLCFPLVRKSVILQPSDHKKKMEIDISKFLFVQNSSLFRYFPTLKLEVSDLILLLPLICAFSYYEHPCAQPRKRCISKVKCLLKVCCYFKKGNPGKSLDTPIKLQGGEKMWKQ